MIIEDVIDHKRIEMETRNRADEFAALYETSLDLAMRGNLDNLLNTIVKRAAKLLHTSIGAFFLFDEARRDLQGTISTGFYESLTIHLELGEGVVGWVAQTGQPLIVKNSEVSVYLPGSPPVVSSLLVPMLFSGDLVGVLLVGENTNVNREFTDLDMRLLTLFASQAASVVYNSRLYEKTIRQLDRLSTLRLVDAAILNTSDLDLTLNILLTGASTKLNVDAAAILLFDKSTCTLQYRAVSGLDVMDKRQLPVHHLTSGFSGWVAQEGRMMEIHHPEMITSYVAHLTEKKFLSYYGVPLIAKNKLIGVMEIFNCKVQERDREWQDFLLTLAGQAAIAVDNAVLFETIQHSNINLHIAYEATLEGWSRALDLRDHETEGHTQRVAKLAQRLARIMGLEPDEVLNIRRGALLHDIGKMGVPDRILRKRGPLTKREWAIMHKHPQLAFDLLSPILYLNHAVDIPYCHHEKWDGTGYPRGLRGEEIPLAARIFAVVDVYDALTSDRPYRKKWSVDKAIQYIRDQAGTYFDPHITAVFIREIETMMD